MTEQTNGSIVGRPSILIDDELQALIDLTKDMQRGDVVEHDLIVETTSVEQGTPKWQKLIRHWKKYMLEDRNIYIVAVPSLGYALPTEVQQLEKASRLERGGARGFARAQLAAGVIDPDALDETCRAVQDSIVQTSEGVRAQVKKVRAERRFLLSKQEAMPRLELS